METTVVYWSCFGKMENEMEITESTGMIGVI